MDRRTNRTCGQDVTVCCQNPAVCKFALVYAGVISPPHRDGTTNKEGYVKHLRMEEPRPGLGGLLLQMFRMKRIACKQGIRNERRLTKEYNKYVVVGSHTVRNLFFI